MRKRMLFSRVLPISSLLLIILFKFQNCAPIPGDSSAVDGQVRITDRWQVLNVAFLNESEAVAAGSANVEIKGLCVGTPNGEIIHWELLDTQGEIVLDQGSVICDFGNFIVSLRSQPAGECDSSYALRAARDGDSNNSAETKIQILCGAG